VSPIGLLVIAAGLLLVVALSVAKKLVVDEVSGWLTLLSECLIRRAAEHLPRQGERYAEEWLGELAALGDRRLSGLWHAWSVLQGSRSMGAELEEAVLGETESSEPVKPTPKLAPDLERIVALVRGLVERTKLSEFPMSQLLAELTSLREEDDLEEQLQRIDEGFAAHLEVSRASEPYRRWTDGIRTGDPSTHPAPELRDERPREQRWSGLSGPAWWRRR
jgi:hypothetical protein